MSRLGDFFSRFASWCTWAMGTSTVFMLACISVMLWLAMGPSFQFNVAWNFAANSSTTVITFLMIFLVQHTVNRDTKALHLKIDELLRAQQHARTDLVDLEHRPQGEVEQREEEFTHVREHAHDQPKEDEEEEV